MENSSTRKSKIGIVAAAVTFMFTAVLSIIQIWEWFAQPEASLSATVKFQKNPTAQAFNAFKGEIKNLIESERLNKSLAEVGELTEDQEKFVTERIAPLFWSFYNDAADASWRWENAGTILNVVLENQGSKTLRGLQITVPYQFAFSEEAEISEGKRSSRITISELPIEFGELKPGETKSFEIWCKVELYEPHLKSIRVVHEDGFADLITYFDVASNSLPGWLHQNRILVSSIVIFPLTILIMVSMGALLSKLDLKKLNSKLPQNEEGGDIENEE